MKVLRRHPSAIRLEAWLDTGDPVVDAHVVTCERCARVLENTVAPGPALGDILGSVLTPPADLQARLHRGIAKKIQTREDVRLLAELLGLPLDTLRAMGSPPTEAG